MYLQNTKSQVRRDNMFDASGTIGSSGTQLLLPRHQSRAYFFFQNNGTHAMFFEIGSARATATITNGSISSVAVTNAGFNFTYPPRVMFDGGGNAGNSTYLGLNQPGGEGPNQQLTSASPASARCTLAPSAVSLNKVNTIVVDAGGSGFVVAPYVFIANSDLDPYGCALPAAGVGIQVGAGGGWKEYNGTVCPTDSIAVFGTANDAFTCKWMI